MNIVQDASEESISSDKEIFVKHGSFSYLIKNYSTEPSAEDSPIPDEDREWNISVYLDGYEPEFLKTGCRKLNVDTQNDSFFRLRVKTEDDNDVMHVISNSSEKQPCIKIATGQRKSATADCILKKVSLVRQDPQNSIDSINFKQKEETYRQELKQKQEKYRQELVLKQKQDKDRQELVLKQKQEKYRQELVSKVKQVKKMLELVLKQKQEKYRQQLVSKRKQDKKRQELETCFKAPITFFNFTVFFIFLLFAMMRSEKNPIELKLNLKNSKTVQSDQMFTESVLHMYTVASQFNLTNVQEKCVEFLKDDTEPSNVLELIKAAREVQGIKIKEFIDQLLPEDKSILREYPEWLEISSTFPELIADIEDGINIAEKSQG